ncbi:MAG: hypothetical protein JW919_07035 [Candidatus Omnitrophica bacterium]|nr:hypothetical protein [Candidatus Omnitrophota bacterium]
MKLKYFIWCISLAVASAMLMPANAAYAQDDDSTRQVLKQGLLGAGVGAISASASGGKAGQGALVGAGTAVIGSALLDALTAPPRSTYRRSAPPPDDYYYTDAPEEYYEEPPQESSSQKILKQGLVGAGTGAIAAGVSGGDAGKGALIGAGTSVIGNALLDTLTQPSSQRRGRVYRRIPSQQTSVQQSVQPQYETTPDGTRKKIIRKYDENGKVVSEEEIYY